jgi:hypothetical protein
VTYDDSTVDFFKNGTADGSSPWAEHHDQIIVPWTIGGTYFGGTSLTAGFNGIVMEFAIMSGVLSNANRSAVENCLKDKYALF